MYELTSSVVDDEEHVQRLKPKSVDREQVTCPNLVGVLIEELSPAGGGRSIVRTPHVSGDSARTNPEAKTGQFRLDSALSPQRIIPSHTANEIPEFEINLLAPSSRRAARSPAPVGFPALAMPANNGIGLYDDQTPAPT